MAAKEEFIDLVADYVGVHGYDKLTCKVIAILYAEPGELSLDEISSKTGYSLSALSTNLKLSEQFGMIKRISKPGSKKAYFYMEKSVWSAFLDHLIMEHDHVVMPSRHKLPEIIQRLKSEKTKDSKEEVKIAEKYYKDILLFDKLVHSLKDQTEKMNI
jgi:HTH-type transcriptional regulator, osmoprotectant uptake regulator